MEGRDFAAPAHLLSERGALVHRAASRIAPSGHSSVQHAGHFPPGKYYPSHIPMAPHSGSGLMGNSSASFMGTFLASSLGSPPSHPSHASRPSSSPSSPSFRGGPHSSASQIWFPHSHEAAPGYPRFSGSLAHTFLPMSHLDHHANSGVLYGQHRFYDTQKENFYLRGLPSQPPLISANHSLPPMSRAGSGHSQGSCSRDRDAGVGTGLHKGLKEGSVERGVVPVKDKERSSSKQEAKDRQQQHHSHQPPQPTHHHHSHSLQQHPHYSQHPQPLEEVNSRALERHKTSLAMEYNKEHPQSIGKSLSACLHNSKMQNGDAGPGAGAKASMSSCGGDGTALGAIVGSSQVRHMGSSDGIRCTKEGISGEMRISEHPSDCLERGQAPLHHSLPYSVPPPLHMAAAAGAHPHPHPHAHTHSHPGGFACLQLHPSHPHHPHHSHHTHHHADFFCAPTSTPLANPATHERGPANVGREPKVTGPTFVPSVADMGDKPSGPFQPGNPDCQGVGSGGGGSNNKEKVMEKNGGNGHHSSWHRKQPQQQQQQQHSYRKAEKASDWIHSHHQHLQPSQLPPPPQLQQPPHPQQQHQVIRSRSAECINSSVDMDVFRNSMPQGPKTGNSVPHSVNNSPYRDCSHSGPPPNSSPLANKSMGQHSGPGPGGSCSLQRDGQKVARIRHQQHGRPASDAPSPAELNQATSQEMKRKMDMSPYGYSNSGQHHHQQPTVPPWAMRPPHHMSQPEEEQRKSYMELGSTGGQHSQPQQQQQQPGMSLQPPQAPPAPSLSQQQQQPQQQLESQGPTQGESSAMKSLLKYSNQQQPLLLSQKSPFGGLGSLKSGPAGGSCALQGNKQTLPSRKGPANDNERPDYSGRGRDMGESGHGESEVRQPPVGIAVAVARQREPPCRSADSHPNNRQGRVHPSVKGQTRTMYPSDPTTEDERKRMSGEQIGLACLDRERDAYIRDNKERVEFARIHPTNSCHGDLASHLMVPGGTSLQSGQLGDPAAHSAHHHWMPRTGSPSLWMTGHSYAGIGHTGLHQNLPPGFSAAMPGPLQPVLPLPQDPSAQLVVLPTEPAASHHLDVMEQPGLWPPVYGARGPPSHMQHPAVYSRSQFLRQQELYALQQHQQLQHQHQHQSYQSQQPQPQSQPQQQQQQPQPQQPQQQHQQQPQPQPQHRATHGMDMQHQATHNAQMQKRPTEPSVELEELILESRTSKPAKPYAYNPPHRNTPPPGACAAHLSPCCQSPSVRALPKSTPSTPCPAPSPAAAAPHSPAISPASPQMPKGAESQDKRVEGQPPRDYPESLEPDLPPGYTYPAISMGYRSGPSPQDVQLAEPADLEAVQVEPAERAPQTLASLGEELDCQAVVRPLPESLSPKEVEQEEEMVADRVLERRGDVEVSSVTAANYVPGEEAAEEQGPAEEEVLVCPPAESPVCEAASCPVPLPADEPPRLGEVITLEEDDAVGEVSPVQSAPKAGAPKEQGAGPPTVIELDPASPTVPESRAPAAEEAKADGQRNNIADAPVDFVCLSPGSASAPSPGQATVPHKPLVPCYWSLELLIAAAFCTDVPPFPLLPFSMPAAAPPQPSSHQGMELLSELADLELQQQMRSSGKSHEDELLMFGLQSLATLATARALEMDSQDCSSVSSGGQLPARKILNLRRKCSWTPRNEPVCPAKGSMETMDGPELAMRVKLAELQRRYKEKQKELAKLQRKHDHQKEETPRSPARRGPGRPRKRKPTLSTGPVSSSEGQRKVKSMGAGLALSPEDLGAGGDGQRRKKRLSSRSFERLSSTQQIKVQSCRKSSFQSALGSKLAGDVAQLKQRAQVKKSLPASSSRDKEVSPCNSNPKHGYRSQVTNKVESRRESGGQSDTASVDSGPQESWPALLRRGHKRASASLTQNASCSGRPRARVLRGQRGEATEDGESSPAESESSDQDEEEEDEDQEEEEGSFDTDEGQDYRVQSSKDTTSSSSLTGPSPSSVVKLEANQKARNKKQRQELYGTHNLSGAEGEVKIKKKPPCLSSGVKKYREDHWPLGARQPRGLRGKEPRWGSLGNRGNRYRRSTGLATFPTTSERLNKATRKNTALRGAIAKRRSGWPSASMCSQGMEAGRSRRSKDQQPKGRAVSRLLESFAADEGFQMDGSSFSEEEDSSCSYNNKCPDFPNCVLTKELLTDGLKVLISKEDELLYAARVHTLELPDIFSIVIDGERGNRPRIYSLDQLLQEAVLDIRPESEAMLSEGTRVCAYWSERSRCLYPGYVHRGSSSDEGKQGGVMVEFDDGDRGKISLPNIRLLPPGYQIHCGESSPALLVPSGTTAKRSSCLELPPMNDRLTDRHNTTNTVANRQTPVTHKRKPGRPKGSGKNQKQQQQQAASKNPSPFLSWSSMANTRKRTSDNLFQLNGATRKVLKGKDDDLFPLPQTQPLTSVPVKGLFSSRSFEVDSFSSIANGYSSFCAQSTALSLGARSGLYSQKRKQEELVIPRSKKSGQEFLVKLDHEGVTSPKTKNSKALLLRGVPSGVSSAPRTEAYSHPVLLVKDNKKGSASMVELLPKGTTPQRKSSPSLRLGEYSDLGFSSHRECHISYSDLDDEEAEEEEERRRSALTAASGGLRTTGHFLSRLSVSSSSSGSSSSSSSGSLSSSSLCSSDNDSSYSSEDEDSSTLMLQSCLSSHRGLLQPSEPSTSSRPHQHSFVAKAVAVSNTKGGLPDQISNKSLKRKECTSSTSKPSKEFTKKPRMLPNDSSFIPRPKMSAFLAGRQMWKWSGDPTQRRGLKGKARKLFYKAIVRGRDTVRVGDCAVFLSAGRPNLPYVGRIENFWESWSSSMVVKVKWFYHPEETKLGKRHRDGKHALYQSCHEDENDVQTISHKCQVVSREEYERLTHNQKPNSTSSDLYYLAGTYDPTTGQLVTAEGVSILC
ncbi:BAH and coiled-coil domain-containing protein 1 isoform X4 [Betta splendens]|uniref:BAH and coiled-coil domain-containing protein 1 isoform X4 n=1 Tax=Betta splendens TaxID=158456 RepID=A0A6P7N6E7_BETSP|nr:BAH and coiled-coil domain-containing protein 1 isoform X4 [Betta splendens]